MGVEPAPMYDALPSEKEFAYVYRVSEVMIYSSAWAGEKADNAMTAASNEERRERGRCNFIETKGKLVKISLNFTFSRQPVKKIAHSNVFFSLFLIKL